MKAHHATNKLVVLSTVDIAPSKSYTNLPRRIRFELPQIKIVKATGATIKI